MVAVDPRTGAVRAVVGAREHTPRGFNRALHAKRQPGSTFKPFVYAAAIREGFSPATLVLDEPVEVVDDEGKLWRPANHGGYAGQITLRRALSRSANAATVRISQAVGLEDVVAIARSAGITSPLPAVPALALGSAEVTPIELVAAYAPFANGGWRIRPTLVQRIERPEGGVLWQAPAQPREQVLDNQDAFLMTTLLRSVVDHGTGLPIRELGVRGPVAGKTGTTNDGADVWFVGYTPSVVAGVWFGYDTPAPIGGGATGGDLAAPAWARWYQKGWAGRGPEREWQPPAGVVTRTIDRYNGFLATEWCPEVRTEYFDEHNAPTDYCPEHRGSTFDRIERGVSNFFKRVFGL
jgi:penicillin-binding protein 1A